MASIMQQISLPLLFDNILVSSGPPLIKLKTCEYLDTNNLHFLPAYHLINICRNEEIVRFWNQHIIKSQIVTQISN